MSIKKCLHAILMGIQTGSAVYLIVLALSIQKNPPTTSNIISVMAVSYTHLTLPTIYSV